MLSRVLSWFGAAAALCAALVYMYVQQQRICSLREQCAQYRANTEVLLSDVARFRVRDSLNAVRADALQFKVSEFEKLRAEDAALIKELRSKSASLEKVIQTQTQTITEMRGSVRDSIVYIDRMQPDTLRCIDIVDKWVELHGCAGRNREFVGQLTTWDELAICCEVKYRRFLGFLWRTKRVQSRSVEAVSLNPHTEITNINYIHIVK